MDAQLGPLGGGRHPCPGGLRSEPPGDMAGDLGPPGLCRAYGRPKWAEVTEGIPFSWSRERYDWSTPGRVVLDQLDSNVAFPGGRIAYTITDSSGGCTVACDRLRRFRHIPRGLLAGTIMRLVGARILRWQFAKSLRRLPAAQP